MFRPGRRRTADGEIDWEARPILFRIRTVFGDLIHGAPRFRQLNEGWNADSNSPEVEVRPRVDGSIDVSFVRSAVATDPHDPECRYHLVFRDCRRWRETPLNDHGWYYGQCRFGQASGKWGEFFEVTGNFRDRVQSDFGPGGRNTPWVSHSGKGKRNFHFHFRDSTVEASASRWELFSPDGESLADG